MKIGFFGLPEQDKKDFYQQKLTGHELSFYDSCLNEQHLPSEMDFDIISNFVECQITPQIIDSLPNLKMIAVRSTGFDNIDIEYAKIKNIIVSNVPAYGSHTVAEFTFGLILALSRKIPQAVFKTKYQHIFNYEGLKGFDLFGKTLGVIGTGKIGANVIQIAKGFGMNILAYDPYPNEQLKQDLGFNYVGLEELLANSDIVTIHSPATPETNHLINKDNIFKTKKGALLINTARGSIVETNAIYEAITTEHLAGVALDVLEEEKELKVSDSQSPAVLQYQKLVALPQVIITPHMAFYTEEAEQSIMQTTVDNILGFIDGKPQNIVHG